MLFIRSRSRRREWNEITPFSIWDHRGGCTDSVGSTMAGGSAGAISSCTPLLLAK